MVSLNDVDEIIALVEEARKYKLPREQDDIESSAMRLLELLDRMDKATQRILADFEELPVPAPLQQAIEQSGGKKERFYLNKKTRKRYLKEVGANEQILKRILHPKKRQEKTFGRVDYTIYRPSLFGRLANLFFEGVSRSLVRMHPRLFDSLHKAVRSSDMHVLSQTYVSVLLLSGFLSFVVLLILGVVVNFLLGMPVVFALASSIVIALAGGAVAMGGGYLYPSTVVGSRKRMITNDLPFMIIHMAAVASSGAKPLSMFTLIVSSGEYKGVESEVKKVLNYVNLLGYDLSTALKTVASTTPSPRFRDLLTGMVATIESGGSLKSYLNSMAHDAMHTYGIERKKYVQTLSTYSDIYTGILIAAPLLFIVTLAIINLLGGTIGGLSVKALALGGTYVVLPFLNIAFLLFLTIVQPEL